MSALPLSVLASVDSYSLNVFRISLNTRFLAGLRRLIAEKHWHAIPSCSWLSKYQYLTQRGRGGEEEAVASTGARSGF